MLSTWNQEVQYNFNLEGFQVSRSETRQSGRSQLMEGLVCHIKEFGTSSYTKLLEGF